jgi:hypothetical protein
MSLGFNLETRSGGDILPIVKWDAKAGDLIKQDRYQAGDGTWQKDEQELGLPIQIGMDLANIEIGWLSFAAGAPDFQMVKAGEPIPAQPSPDHKQAFRVRIGSTDLGLREFSHSAKTVLRAMDALHNQYQAEAPANPGKLPVVTIAGTETIKINSPQGELRFKVPDWSITSWIDRPAMMDGGGAAPSEPVPAEVAAAATQPPAAAPAGANLF